MKDAFFKAYVECALWSSTDDDGEPLDGHEVAPDALKSMREDCEDFCQANKELLDKAGDDSQNGHDFWLTRNGHGAGFWDRGYGKTGARLTEASKVYGSVTLYVGDDELVRTM